MKTVKKDIGSSGKIRLVVICLKCEQRRKINPTGLGFGSRAASSVACACGEFRYEVARDTTMTSTVRERFDP